MTTPQQTDYQLIEEMNLDPYDREMLKRIKRTESKLTVLMRHLGIDDWGNRLGEKEL